ncbi:hypothetical protein CEXT_744861 [Caerostris extrusa]|uniref:Uncharacterized protein n=1 Tax=Caerostris extrusa TaxID=172846 RepID=A0AAV4MAL1_CAEEX|nr:hypothetical protein CEXT_744861 [Caerostris extrusa]
MERSPGFEYQEIAKQLNELLPFIHHPAWSSFPIGRNGFVCFAEGVSTIRPPYLVIQKVIIRCGWFGTPLIKGMSKSFRWRK